jgi:hypothetical protein
MALFTDAYLNDGPIQATAPRPTMAARENRVRKIT